MKNLFDLSGQVALVTGATGGLGREMVAVLAAQGARVIATDHDLARCEALAQELGEQGLTVHALGADLSNAAAIDRLVEQANGLEPHIDILVCNAGVQGPAAPLGHVSDADWQAVMQINLRSAVHLSASLMPAMAERGHGSVVLLSSIAGLRGNGAIGLYGLSKAALAELARNLAVQWGPRGVRCNAVSPGLIRTPLAVDLLANQAFMQRRLQMTPLRRVGEPHEVAGVVAFLASAAGAFVNGHNLVVDGGTTITDGS
jgi:NAD(P)-dependent dehydrogenase (short-subunit alcohol dehydrogenase family)